MIKGTVARIEDRYVSVVVLNWPSAMTPEVINSHFPACKACGHANQKKLPFMNVRSNEMQDQAD